eukprot:SAG11_NODE_1411_length_4995_cov_21.158088_3_plen_191_part_00
MSESDAPPEPEPELALDAVASTPNLCCLCTTSPASSQTRILTAILAALPGWEEWPAEDVVYTEGEKPRKRPRDSKKVEFTNASFYATRFSISGTGHPVTSPCTCLCASLRGMRQAHQREFSAHTPRLASPSPAVRRPGLPCPAPPAVAVDDTEHLYDELLLAELTGAANNAMSTLCPPTYIFKSGAPVSP